MKIRKLFKYEASHQVHEAWSTRCKNSIHGHSFIVEFIFSGNVPDSAHMVMDFGLVKKQLHPFVDSFDHTHILWENEKYAKVNAFIKEHNERWITLPFNSSAEMQAKMFFIFAHNLIEYMAKNGETNSCVKVDSVRLHETQTGYAEYSKDDLSNCMFPDIRLSKIQFSHAIVAEWSKSFIEFFKTLR
jgi:6-pyruvoyltetrahydropterin/6-carboxytetrahydropterin synthase